MSINHPCNFSSDDYRCNVVSLQTPVIIIPVLLSSSTLLVIGCIVWKTCRKWRTPGQCSPPQ